MNQGAYDVSHYGWRDTDSDWDAIVVKACNLFLGRFLLIFAGFCFLIFLKVGRTREHM